MEAFEIIILLQTYKLSKCDQVVQHDDFFLPLVYFFVVVDLIVKRNDVSSELLFKIA